ncbi:Arginine-tRNA-protein transferase, predicted, prokaryotic [Rhodopirellula maiorica SM1]|uniref:Arginine-tRNA-protein transferase, predicted, prokaryotic n=1 Tax=Rhodopirellula maiorica SM1 TaxID=1265738 RepID=M5RJD9_9BACT|nr:arginyltransferase [Rhodopirellula maiorica]EMI19415.1 Arginine-tRNA-protein transferase, predicted, prokaryotic [Rhodopirellula maiorica SM1]
MNRPSEFRMPNDECRLVVVQDQLQPCPYLDEAVARMPLRLPIGNVTPEITDQMLVMGFRRSGDFVYRTQCPACQECRPTRIDVSTFRLTKSFKRVLRRGDQDLSCQWNPPSVDSLRVEIFNQHRQVRNLGLSDEPVDEDAYRSFLADSCCQTRELSIWKDGELIAVSIVDLGRESTSAVYTHFRPEHGRYSLGTYAVLKQIEWAAATGRRYVYLGMYVAENDHLNYKSRFKPQQRLIDGKWIDFDKT